MKGEEEETSVFRPKSLSRGKEILLTPNWYVRLSTEGVGSYKSFFQESVETHCIRWSLKRDKSSTVGVPLVESKKDHDGSDL